MTTATGGTTEDDEVLTTEVEGEPEPPRERIPPRTARAIFVGLAAVAGVALLAAVVVILLSERLSPGALRAWLYAALGVVLAVVVAEIVLLLVARPRKA